LKNREWKDNPTVFADFHADFYTTYAKPIADSNINDRTAHQFDILKSIIKIANERESPLLFAGDFFNERGQVDVRVVNRAVKVLHDELKVPMLMVAGNHDQIDNSNVPETSVDFFPYINLEDKEGSIEVFNTVSRVQYGNTYYDMLPYTEDVATFKRALEELTATPKEDGCNYILVAHVGVDGAKNGKYNHRLGGAYGIGDLYPDYYDQIFVGHYHDRQKLAENAVYVGSTIPNSFNDEGHSKGIYLYDGTNNKATYKALPSKKFITLDTSKVEQGTLTSEFLSKNYYKIISNSLDEIKELQQESLDENIAVNFEVKAEVKTESRLGIDPQAGSKEIVKAYTSQYCPEATDIALQVLEEV